MSLKTWVAKTWAAKRAHQWQRIAAQPEAVQRSLLGGLLTKATSTAFGKDHHFSTLHSYEAYQQAVPVRDYEALLPYLERTYAGDLSVLWPGRPLYFAKTSGTTAGSKYIPLTAASLPYHLAAARDALLLHIHRTGDTSFLHGKLLFLSGSPVLEKNPAGIPVGRLSGISTHYVPGYLQRNRVPNRATNSIEDWEEKVRAIARELIPQDLRLISGIPPWVRMLLEEVQHQSGKSPAAVWPNLKLFVQGGVDYAPYKQLITQVMGRELTTVEVYPASEGFFAVQDAQPEDGLLLLLQQGIFYEFIPLEEYGKPQASRLPLWQVALNQPYALVISTNAGLWAYSLGDVVKFTSLQPYRLKVVGRVKHFLSAFGEHVIEEEVNAALLAAVQATGATVAEATVAPVVQAQPPYHEWLVEFEQPPTSLAAFSLQLDATLRARNSYYDDLRAGNLLGPPVLTLLQPQAVRTYMARMGKLGGQNKFPRLSNNRSIAVALQELKLGT